MLKSFFLLPPIWCVYTICAICPSSSDFGTYRIIAFLAQNLSCSAPTVNVLKFRTLVACQTSLDKQCTCRPRSDEAVSGSSMRRSREFCQWCPFFIFLIRGKRIKIALKVGHHRPASETPFKRRFAGGPMIAQHCMLAWQLRDFSGDPNQYCYETLYFLNFQGGGGGGGGGGPPVVPSGSPHMTSLLWIPNLKTRQKGKSIWNFRMFTVLLLFPKDTHKFSFWKTKLPRLSCFHLIWIYDSYILKKILKIK